MQKVKIIAHSGCDLTFEQAEAAGVVLLPDLVVFGETVYRNNLDIHPQEFYDRIRAGGIFPKSAHPSLEEFAGAFRACEDCSGVLCMVMSGEMTGTVNTARIAAQMVKDEGFGPEIRVYDTRQVSFGMGIAVLRAAALAEQGASLDGITAYLDGIIPRIGVYFIMRSLEYARKGGRIGAIRARAADALGVKPLLNFSGGTVSDISLNRRFSDGLEAIFTKYREGAGEDPEVFLFHADNEEDALRVRDRILAFRPEAKVRLQWVGPVVGIYTGVGCVGVAFIGRER